MNLGHCVHNGDRGRPFWRFVIAVLALSACGIAQETGAPSEELLALARQYLDTTDEAAKQALARKIDMFEYDPLRVVRALRPKPEGDVKPGYYREQHFKTPELLQKHPDDLLFYIVPESYRPDRSTGLIIMMHGGGHGSKRTAPGANMQKGDTGNALGDMFMKSGMIAVGPSAPWNEKSSARWCLPEADNYLRDIVLEFQNRFNIDPNRVFLMGHSMGGFGAYHQAQRQPDRFAAVTAIAGAWRLACWPVIRGTPLWIVHGANDAVPGKRPRYTDVAFGRLADRLLTEQGVPHEYREHQGGHGMQDCREDVRHFVELMATTRRDPYFPHVVLVNPRGWSHKEMYEGPHNRWLTLLDRTDGKLPFDACETRGPRQFWGMPLENWQGWRLEPRTRQLPAGMVEAVNKGGNHFQVTTRNVRAFALWLHPKMVDFSKPIHVVVNGKEVFDVTAKPSISTALRSFERRRDRGLIYPAEVRITLPDK